SPCASDCGLRLGCGRQLGAPRGPAMNRRERRAADKAAKHRMTGNARSQPPEAGGSSPLARALTLYHSGKLGEAEHAYRAILAATPRDADALYQLGILLGQLGRLPEAEDCLAAS